uniref:M96 mating-specific protein family n=1 Tax=Globisporangium ultimum (strain ATCC 200006 / CBS 805.95 / DAOM BR144) TaxID=431595 RepID=K3W8X2_GLOUD
MSLLALLDGGMLEATLAFVDDCTIDSDEEMGVDATAEFESALPHKAVRDAMDEKNFFDAVDEFVNRTASGGGDTDENDEDGSGSSEAEYVTMTEALHLLDAYEVVSDPLVVGEDAVVIGGTDAVVPAPMKAAEVKSQRPVAKKPRQSAVAVPKPRQQVKTATMQPKANATLATTAVSATSPKSDEQPAKPTKKRVRKQREELLYLREKVVEMENLLDKLQKKDPNGCSGNSPTSSGGMVDAETVKQEGEKKISIGSVWERVAERQYKERERSERENRKLKATLEGQIKLVRSLESLLTHDPDIDMLGNSAKQKRLKYHLHGFPSDDSEILEELKTELAEAYPMFEQEYAASALKDMIEDADDISVKNNSDQGMFVQFVANKIVPFDLQVTASVLWRFLAQGGIKSHCYYYHELEDVTRDYSARDFGVKMEARQKNLDIHGKHVIKKIEEQDRVVLLWCAVVQPVKFTGVPTNGMRFRERGWTVIQQNKPSLSKPAPTSTACDTLGADANSAKVKSTVIKTHITFTPDLDETVAIKNVGALTDLVISSVESNMVLFTELIDGLLREQEWRNNHPITV